MNKHIINLLYKICKVLIDSKMLEFLKNQMIIISVTELEGYQKKLEVLNGFENKAKESKFTYKKYIVSMIIDILYAYMKENNIVR